MFLDRHRKHYCNHFKQQWLKCQLHLLHWRWRRLLSLRLSGSLCHSSLQQQVHLRQWRRRHLLASHLFGCPTCRNRQRRHMCSINSSHHSVAANSPQTAFRFLTTLLLFNSNPPKAVGIVPTVMLDHSGIVNQAISHVTNCVLFNTRSLKNKLYDFHHLIIKNSLECLKYLCNTNNTIITACRRLQSTVNGLVSFFGC